MLTPGMGKGPENLMSNDRFRSQFGAWSVLAFNILLVGNLSALNPYVLETWSNEEVIAVNQVRATSAMLLVCTTCIICLPSYFFPAYFSDVSSQNQGCVSKYPSLSLHTRPPTC